MTESVRWCCAQFREAVSAPPLRGLRIEGVRSAPEAFFLVFRAIDSSVALPRPTPISVPMSLLSEVANSLVPVVWCESESPVPGAAFPSTSQRIALPWDG